MMPFSSIYVLTDKGEKPLDFEYVGRSGSVSYQRFTDANASNSFLI